MRKEDGNSVTSGKTSVPLSTRVSPKHRTKLDQMKRAGLKITIIVEQGIDALYERLAQAGLIKESGQLSDPNGQDR